MDDLETATFGAGCFWAVQHYFDQVPGVIKTNVGYTGGDIEDPTYDEVCSDKTGHVEAIQIKYDSDLVEYATLVKHFFRMHNPTELNRQGPDVGVRYRSVIFYHDEQQRQAAAAIMNEAQNRFEDRIVTSLEPSKSFYSAENEHQKFSEKTGRGVCSVEYKPVD